MDAKDIFPWCLEMMTRKQVIVLSRITDAPPAAARDLDAWKHYGVKSALTFPLFAGEGPSFGALGFNTLKEERDWPEELVKSLHIVSQVFAGALNRKFTEINLRESETRLRLAADSANAGLWSWDYKTGKIWVTGKTRSLYGFFPDEGITADRFYTTLHPDDLERISLLAEQAFREGTVVQTEYRIVLPDGGIKWIAVRAQAFLNASGEPESMTGVSLDITERKLAETALEESRTQIAAVMNSTKDFIWSVDPERFGLLSWNRAFRDYFLDLRGIDLHGGMTPTELVPPEYVPLWHDLFSRALREGFVVVEYVVVAQTITLLLSLHVMKQGGQVFGISVFGRDITELKQAEEARLENMARYQAVVEAFDGFIYICSQDYRVEFMNQRMIERTGRNAVGEACYKALHNTDSVCAWCVNERVFQGETVRWEVQSPKDHRWYYVVNTPIRHADGTMSKQSMIMDITERKLAEEALKESESALRNSQKDLRRLAGKLISSQENELRRLARELHDDLTQRLAVTAIEAGKLELELNKMQHVPPDPVVKISQIKDQLIKVSEDVHRISRQLHPSILDDLGLVRAIESECAAIMRRENIEIIFRTKDVPDVIANDIALCLYRVVQEGLRNVIAHSRANNCEIFLKGVDNTLSLAVSDDGVGFDPGEVRQKPGLGLSSMRERAQLIQGDFSIKSQPGQGTLILICVPLKAGDA
jgi:PAS domain S-box-containing protein